jgi:hypothetical protein
MQKQRYVCAFSFFSTFYTYRVIISFFYFFRSFSKASIFLYMYFSCAFIHRPQKTPFACQVNNRGSVGDGCSVVRRAHTHTYTRKKKSEKEKTSMEAIYLKK